MPAFTWAAGEREGFDVRLRDVDQYLAAGDHDLAAIALETISNHATRAAQKIRAAARPAAARPGVVVLDDFAHTAVTLSRIARQTNGGRPLGVWSSREQIAVALVLRDERTLLHANFNYESACRFVADGMTSPPADMTAWLTAVRAEVDAS